MHVLGHLSGSSLVSEVFRILKGDIRVAVFLPEWPDNPATIQTSVTQCPTSSLP